MEVREPDRLDRMLARAADGDAHAWRVIVDVYARRVFGLLARQCGDRDLAEEITQATFVQMVSHLGRYRERGKFEPWLFRIAMNRLRDEMRRRKRQAKSMDMSGGRNEEPSAWAVAEEDIIARQADAQNPAELASRTEQVQRLREVIKKMSPPDQEILYLRHTAGLSFAQIAQILDEPVGTVLSRGHRALEKLKQLMREDEH